MSNCRVHMTTMKAVRIASLSLAAIFAASGLATASSSDWAASEGGRIRLVTTGLPDADGRFTGVLQIDLKPGWKTYWRDPGDAGVPPQLDLSANPGIVSAELDFPAPQRHDDGYNVWAGYDYPVALPITFKLASPGGPANVDASVFLGICETICIPLQARLAVDPAADPGNADDAALVQAALDALPEPEQPDFGATVVSADKEMLTVEAAFPGDPETVDFFLAGEAGYAFGQPEKAIADGKVTFSVPILARPDEKPADVVLHYTLVAGSAAVAGLLPAP